MRIRQPPELPPPTQTGTWGLWPASWGPQAARMRSWNLSWCSGRKRRPPRWARGGRGKVSAGLGRGLGVSEGKGPEIPSMGILGRGAWGGG